MVSDDAFDPRRASASSAAAAWAPLDKAQRRPGALALPGAEGQDLEVGQVADLHAPAVRREVPLGAELVDVVPDARVPAQRVGVDEDPRLRRDVVAHDGRRLE